DRDRQAVHDLEDAFEVAALNREELCQRFAAAGLVRGDDHLAHQGDTIALEEHVLRPAQPDALGAEFARPFGIERDIGIRAYAQPASLVRPGHEPAEFFADLRYDELGLP